MDIVKTAAEELKIKGMVQNAGSFRAPDAKQHNPVCRPVTARRLQEVFDVHYSYVISPGSASPNSLAREERRREVKRPSWKHKDR